MAAWIIRIITILLFSTLAHPALAITQPEKGNFFDFFTNTIINASGLNVPKETIYIGEDEVVLGSAIRIMQFLLRYTALFALIVFMLGGWQWIRAGGNEERIGKAKDLIKNGVIGLALVLVAWAIIMTISQLLTISLTFPTP